MTGDDESASETSAGGLVLLGRIAGAQGLKGEVRINSFTAIPEDIAAYGPLRDAKGRAVTIAAIRPLKGGTVVARLPGITDRNAAEAMQGTELFVERAKLPETEDDEWYYEDLIGLKAVSPDGDEIGLIVAVHNYGAGDLLEVRTPDARQTYLVAFTQDAVPEIDIAGRRVVIARVEEIEDDISG
jgi:16S rRNA processing protein RimM